MLRPQELVDARAAMRAGTLPPGEYRVIEDRAVDTALEIQTTAGVDVVTDGEQRRDIFIDPFFTGMSGFSPIPAHMVEFHGAKPEDSIRFPTPFSITEPITARSCPLLDELAYTTQHTTQPVKVTLPSPTMACNFWTDASRGAYPDAFMLMQAVAEVFAGWMRELADAGCSYIQIDAPDMAEFFADGLNTRAQYGDEGVDPERFVEVAPAIIGELGAVSTPGAIKGLHLCKGNGTQAWIASGGYQALSERLFGFVEGFDVVHLEYDDERSGGFEPLTRLPDDKVAVLGLVSTKWNDIEDRETLKARIDEAARFHPKEQLALATQCGFASTAETAETKKIDLANQAAKLALVAEVAHEIWS